MVDTIITVSVVIVGGGIIALLDWFSPNPPKWVVDFKMRRRK